jgi:bilirubin oxidase
MKNHLSLALATLVSQAFAGDDAWVSPVYKEIFQNPLPFPPVKTPKLQYKNDTTGAIIDYYEVEIKTFQQQVYKGLKPATLYGYDGVSPGPTFKIV